ncbi:MAG: DUF58 domain-containing protein [Candidatus Viridilinea halotolerans]|uniref:DUF58 domain-containing protein n=1 Tax=Candidatus Viridilinea halotolerans TaxID=2491704 RepID=A0A426TUQ7_9CHLR|nr:MAG: DUF58 domain-containing protein [Candidatus Viridilinea halotolerans]
MWFKTIFRRKQSVAAQSPLRRTATQERPLFDEHFLRRIERMSLQAQRTLRGNPASGEHRSQRQLPATIFSDHRPYSSGDDLRYVDWHVYARQNQVLVRLGEAEQDVHVHLLVDASQSMLLGEPSRLRLAQQLVGALGYLALAHSDRVRVVPFGPAAGRPFGPVQGKNHTIALLRFISAIVPQPTTQLPAVLQQYAREHPQGGMLIICSDLLAPGGLAEALRLLRPPRWQTLVLHLLEQTDLQPNLSGPLELEDSETGERMQLTLDAATLAAYRQNFTAWREDLARTCTRYGATYAPLMTHWPLEQQIIPYLRLRRLLW